MVRLRAGRTGMHVNPVACVLFGRERPVTVCTDRGTVRADAIFAEAGAAHWVDFGAGLVDIVYLEYPSAQTRATSPITGDAYRLLCDTLGRWTADSGAEFCGRLGIENWAGDERMTELTRCIDDDPMNRISEREACAMTGLERTALLKRFKRQTGMTFRAYKNWSALKHAAERLPAGEKLGDLGVDAGFADAAHFSRSFRKAFGLSPTDALRAVR